MKAAFHLHLYYPDIAIDLVARIAALGRADIDTLVTHVGPLEAAVDHALDAIPGVVERIAVPNAGWDIGPLFEILPLARERGYDVIGKLHTKKGASGYAAEWRAICYRSLIGSRSRVAAILDAFAVQPALDLIGPRVLYKSVARHMFGNAELLLALAPAVAAPAYPPADWGFFAGTMFWARLPVLERVAVLAARSTSIGENGVRDGEGAHALERLFGLVPVSHDGSIGLADEDGIAILPAPGKPGDEPIIRTLVQEAERLTGPPDADTAALIAHRNPLADYIRHGRDEDALDPNPYFSSDWYNRIHADVFAAGMHPLHHYTHHGAAEGRTTGPLFDGVYYRSNYANVEGDPLRHFLEVGAKAGRNAIPISQPTESNATDGRPHRFYSRFDASREREFLHGIATLPASERAAASDTLVSVIMPAYNREATVGAAIRSVLAQTHRHFELIVVDDGSHDATVAAITPFLADPRVRLIERSHAGVSAARNAGLDAAGGAYIAYLDSDNRWSSWFLEVMTRFLVSSGADAAYSGIALRDDLGHLTGYRGDDFDWGACLEQNYVDLNAFCHRRDTINDVGGFDTALRRMVDWDFILRIGKAHDVRYAPFLGCDYFDGKADRGRITVREPAAYQRLVWTKNRYELAIDDPAFSTKLSLSVAIKIAAPEAEKDNWGDYHFADSLAQAIERLGHRVRIDFREHWSGHALADEEVVIVLRGLIRYHPRPGQIALLWIISHPDQVSFEECDRYTRVYCASGSHAALLRQIVQPPVEALPQATDPSRFNPAIADEEAPSILFCGNSRGQDRDMVRWAIKANRPPAIIGMGWASRVPAESVLAESIDNRSLGPLYAGAGVVLNDHWPSMRAFGIVSNRLFDVVAAGGRAVSDASPAITAVFGDAVAQVEDADALRNAVDAALAEPARAPARIGLAQEVARAHSFDARATRLMADALALVGIESEGAPSAEVARPLRIHILAPHGPYGPQSSAYIRLLAPLTAPNVEGRTHITIGSIDDTVPECDIAIVQRAAMPTIAAVDQLVRTLGEMGASLVTDVDDAFRLIDDDHPEATIYRPLNAALDRAIAASAETWFSTEALAEAYSGIAHRQAVRDNALDPRLWRDWRRASIERFGATPIRLLYMGTHTHGADFALIRPALERLAAERPGAFMLTVIGIDPAIASAPWLTRLSPPAEAIIYPRFVRWLCEQGPFDAGLAPLADTPFNRAKSDIKLLDYAALGLLPIASDMPGYRRAPPPGTVLVPNDGWFAALGAIDDDRQGARVSALAAQEHVWRNRSVETIAPGMVARLEALCGR